jgi:orotidine-5'-phosphate decarboxylase
MNRKDVIAALDFPDKESTLSFLELFEGKKLFVKIGMELFYSEGPSIVEEIKSRGHSIFLDLKLHDIPNTVKKAMISLARLDADMVNVHAAGTVRMMEAAVEGLEEGCRQIGRKERPLIVAVTQLTSTDQKSLEDEILINKDINEVIARYAENAKKAGLDGVVCSPLEAGMIHETAGDGFITVTPGVRPESSDRGDQKRVTTPAMAREIGSDYIVVGRPITKSYDPVKAYEEIRRDFLNE